MVGILYHPSIARDMGVQSGNLGQAVVYQRYVSDNEILMADIIDCESGWNPESKNPLSSAYGLCQFLDGTWQYVQEKWNMELDRYDPDDQYYACLRLLGEEGVSHWLETKNCWSR